MRLTKARNPRDLDQSNFPSLPLLPAREKFMCVGAKWHNHKNDKKDIAASCIINLCLAAGKWCPVSERAFRQELMAFSQEKSVSGRGVADALADLIAERYVKRFQLKKTTYLAPTPDFAHIVLDDPCRWWMI